MHLKNISRLNAFPTEAQGMDVIIVSTESDRQRAYWNARLRAGRGLVVKPGARICCVTEEWPGGAGNGLGSLYAFVKACEQMLEQENFDLADSLQQGAAIAIYHTAGMGKRLFPLTAAEYCNKSAVKLPSLIGGHFLSILEAVIKQTGVFAPVRKGRLCVFWGDQVFIPSGSIETRSKSHIDIFAIVNKLPSEKVWVEKNLSSYGLIAIGKEGQPKDVEKCQYGTIKRLLEAKKIGMEEGAGLSLGSFSLSADMLFALLDEFAVELAHKNGQMDSDPYLWMPLTLDKETYLEVMQDKLLPCAHLVAHYERMQNFKRRFSKVHGSTIFGVTDVGGESYWWDYGTVQSYMHNNLKVCQNDQEGRAMRAFLKLENAVAHSNIRLSRIHNSVVIGVNADQLRIDNCILLNSEVHSFEGSDSLLYHVAEKESIHYPAGTVRADIFLPEEAAHIKMLTHKSRDGKADWSEHLPNNPYSYAELYPLAHGVDPLKAERLSPIPLPFI